MIANENTPVEKYGDIYVKREDLAIDPPGPPFSKIRGLEAKMMALLNEGIKTVGYMDTTVSFAGWGISYFAKLFGMRAVIFYPRYKDGHYRDNLEKHVKIWNEFGATVVPLDKPQRLKINWYRARNMLRDNWPNAFMLEQGFPYPEATRETAKQVRLIPKSILGGSIVISIGSGVICSGVVQGLLEDETKTTVYGITVSPKDLKAMEARIIRRTDDIFSSVPLILIDGGYEYTQRVEMEIPFNCNAYYDRKAWAWLLKHKEELKQPIIFWNIGGEGDVKSTSSNV